MVHGIANPHRGTGLALDGPDPIADAAAVGKLLAQCPAHAQTPLLSLDSVATECGVAQVFAKDERDRMGLDPDGDGFACAWDPAPFRLARQN